VGELYFLGGDLPPKNMPGVIVLPILANKRCIYRVAQKVVHLFFDIQYQQLHKSYNLYPLFPGTLGTFWRNPFHFIANGSKDMVSETADKLCGTKSFFCGRDSELQMYQVNFINCRLE